MPFLGGGGGLVSSLDDYTALVRTLLQGGAPLLQPRDAAAGARATSCRRACGSVSRLPAQEGRGHSFAGCGGGAGGRPWIPRAEGEVYWGGLAATKWFFSPREDLAAVLMTQRYMGSDLPFWGEFKRLVRQAVGQPLRTVPYNRQPRKDALPLARRTPP